MRVMCIDNDWEGDGPPIEYGEILNVIDYQKDEEGEWYEFSERKGYEYETKAFIPLSNVDETERIDEVLENIFVPVKIKNI